MRPASVDTPVTFSTTATLTSPVGTYAITPALQDLNNKLGNFSITKTDGTLTIKSDPAPVVIINAPTNIVALDIFSATGSFTDAGTSNGVYTVEWNFGDGSAVFTNSLTAQHSFTNHGVYNVTLNVRDNHGGVGTATLSVEVISASGVVEEAVKNLTQYQSQSTLLAKAIEHLQTALDAPAWIDQMHVAEKGGDKIFNQVESAAQDLEKLLKKEDKKNVLTPEAEAAVAQALADSAALAQLVAETLYLENEHLQAMNPKKQDHVDKQLGNAKEKLDSATAKLQAGDSSGAIADFQRSWNWTLQAIDTAKSK